MSRYKEFKGWLPATQWMLEKPGERHVETKGSGTHWRGVVQNGDRDIPCGPTAIYITIKDEHGPIEKPVEPAPLPELDEVLVSAIKSFYGLVDAPIQEMFQLAIAQAVRVAKEEK